MRVAQFIVATASRAVEAMAHKAPLPTPIRLTIMPATRSNRREAGCGRAGRDRCSTGDPGTYGQTQKNRPSNMPMTIDRRTFVQTATVIAVAAAGTQSAQAQPSALSQATTAAAAAGAAGP